MLTCIRECQTKVKICYQTRDISSTLKLGERGNDALGLSFLPGWLTRLSKQWYVLVFIRRYYNDLVSTYVASSEPNALGKPVPPLSHDANSAKHERKKTWRRQCRMRMHYIANAWHMYNVSACVTTKFGAIFDFIRNIGPMRANVKIVHVHARTFFVLDCR